LTFNALVEYAFRSPPPVTSHRLLVFLLPCVMACGERGSPDFNPREKREEYAAALFKKRGRKGLTAAESEWNLFKPIYFAASMLEAGEVDALVSGIEANYGEALRPCLHVIGSRSGGTGRVAGLYMLAFPTRELLFFADTTVNIEPDAQALAEIALQTADFVTELGITQLVPLVTERSNRQPTSGALERLERSVIEACKQCGRNRLMEIAAPKTWDELVVPPADSSGDPELRLVAHPGGQRCAAVPAGDFVDTLVAIGPEGGFTEAEVSLAAAHGWRAVDLGPRLLRVETAAVGLASALVLGVE